MDRSRFVRADALSSSAAVLILSFPSLAGLALAEDAGSDLQRSMVWLASAPTGTQVYAAFRKSFRLESEPRRATLRIFADSRYTLWIDGAYVERGPCRFDPVAPELDSIDVTRRLRSGDNAVAVLVHHYHDGKSTTDWASINGRIMRHAPGLAVRLEVEGADGRVVSIATDATWRGSTRTRFQPSPTDRWENTWASIPDRIDARLDPGDWTSPGFDDSAWEAAVPVDGGLWGPIRPRGIPLLRETEAGPLSLVEEARAEGAGWASSFRAERPDAARPLAGVLPLELPAGRRLVIDAGAFVQAYTVLDLDADPGSEVELEHAQGYFDTGREPSGSYGRVSRYVARTGRQTWMGGDTFGFKYLVIRVASGRVRLDGVRIVERRYPFDVVGSFRCDDDALVRLWRSCVRTILVCSEDAYVDCATRERAEWMADGYVVAWRTTRAALAGPDDGPSAGSPGLRPSDPRLLRSLLRHIAQSRQPDGRLKAHHPSDRWDIHGYIEDYSCLWVQALKEYHDVTGDASLVRELWPALVAQLRWFLDRRTERGLVKAREFVYFGNPLLYKECEGATLNAFLHGALRDAATLAGAIGEESRKEEYAKAAADLREAMDRHLWDPSAGSYSGGILEGRPAAPTAHAATACLHFEVATGERVAATRRWLLEHFRTEGFYPYTHQLLLEEILRADTDEADRLALGVIRERWSAMSRAETGTVWEGFGPGESCHEAGAVPAWFLSAWVLGVRPEGPASRRRILIEPHLADLREASGAVATELGIVPVSWRRSATSLELDVTVPEGTRATLALPRRPGEEALTLDGSRVDPPPGAPGSPATIRGRFLTLELGPGRHAGVLTAGTETR